MFSRSLQLLGTAFVFLLYRQAFIDSQILPTHVQGNLKLIYEVLGHLNEFTPREISDNFKFCAPKDHYKLLHEDTMLEDTLCYSKRFDAIRKSCDIDYFSIPLQGEKGLAKLSEKALTMNMLQLLFPKNYEMMKSTFCLLTQNVMHEFLGRIKDKTLNQRRASQFSNKLASLNASPNCLEDIKVIPSSYGLSSEAECKRIFQLLSDHYEGRSNSTTQYLIKTDEHLGRGIRNVDFTLYNELSQQYENGAKCGSIPEKALIQELTGAPILLNGRKIDFRLWVLVVSADPIIIYLYPNTMIISCLDTYDINDLSKENFICNGDVTKQFYKEGNPKVKNPVSMEDTHLVWNLEEWNRYLLSQGLVTDSQWWENTFLPLLETKVYWFMRVNFNNPPQDPRFQALIAFDATLDGAGKLYLFDCNTSPNVEPFTPGNLKLQPLLHKSAILVLKEYLKQRYNRIRTFLNTRFTNVQEQMANLKKALRYELIPQPELHNFRLVREDLATRNCQAYLE